MVVGDGGGRFDDKKKRLLVWVNWNCLNQFCTSQVEFKESYNAILSINYQNQQRNEKLHGMTLHV